MTTCPRCQQTVNGQAVQCPYCGAMLKAFGHPGMPLYQAEEDQALCETCTYHADDTCTFPQRPYARECTLYHNPTQGAELRYKAPGGPQALRLWVQRHRVWFAIALLLGISLLITLVR